MRHFPSALRKLARTPGFTLLSVVTLALGIAATTTIFSVVNGVLLRPLAHPDPDRIVVTTHNAPGLDLDGMGLSDALFLYYRDNARSFDSIALFDNEAATLTASGSPERLGATLTTASFFTVLRTSPALGRSFAEAEERPGSAPVVILSDALWQRRFGSEPGILGRRLRIDGVEREVIGVMPPDFRFMQTESDLYMPVQLDRDAASLGSFGFGGVARLAGGASRAAAEADLDRLLAGLVEAFPEQGAAAILRKGGFTAVVKAMHEEIVGDVRARLWILLAAVGVVLLIACANVANLFIVRAEARQRETAVRTALGATRWQLVGSGMTESLVLSLSAGALGLGVAWLAVKGLIRFGPQDLPRLQEISIDTRVIAVCATVSVLSGAVFGFIHGGSGKLRELAGMLKDGGRSATAGRGRHLVRHVLVGAQVALALVILISSALMVRSFLHLSNVDTGLRPDGVVTASLFLPAADYPDDLSVAGFYQRLLEQVRALPGVESAGALSPLPLDHRFSASGYVVEEFPGEEGDLPPVFGITHMTPDTLETLGVRLVEGRILELRDQEERTGNIVVNQTLARRFWGDKSAVGKRIGPRSADEEHPDPWYTIVGVISDIRTTDLQEDAPEMIYFPTLGKEEDDWVARGLTLVVKASGEPGGLVDSLRRTVWDLDTDLPIARVRTLDEVVRRNKAPMAFTMVMILIAGAVSLALGLVGTFGIISYLVSQRTGEIGVRMALGAQRGQIRAMVLRQGLLLAGAGAVAGVGMAFFLTRWLESLLFEIEALDAPTFVAVPVVLIAVAMLASWFPASRAARIEPVVALRHE